MLEALSPAAGLTRRSPGRRRLVDGVRWRVRTGVPWRDAMAAAGSGPGC
ncbi:hypothetical protein [Streptomyces sp. NPDC090621]